MGQAMTGAVIAQPREMLARAADRESALEQSATTLVIPSMHCGGCLAKVESAIRVVPGVTHVRANLSAQRATILHASSVDSPKLIAALESAGFPATELAGDRGVASAGADQDYLKRLAVTGFATANIMLLSVSVWSGATGDMPAALQAMFHWLSALIALPAVAYGGQPFFRSAVAALRSRRVNMDVPISLGVTLAVGMSLYQTARGSEQVYFDAAVTLLFFLLTGRALDARMRARAAGAAANLLGLRATSASVLDAEGRISRIATRRLMPGMRILTAAGERLAVDGRVVTGETEIDEGLITGETRPRRVKPGDAVYAGTVNLGQPLTTEAVATDEHTLVAEIARLMAAAEQGRARYVRLADRAARIYAPAVHILSLATFLGWLVLGHGWEAALTAAIAVLIITCPCALALAVPAVQVAATSRLFARGVLVKSPDALERLAEIDTVALDKTGTLTLGEPVLIDDPAITNDVLSRAAALAAASRHPYARAVVRAARSRGLDVSSAADVDEAPGLGLSRPTSDGEERLGSARWCKVGTDRVAASPTASLWFKTGDAPAQPLSFEDRLRPDARMVVATLHSAGLATELLSGDRQAEVDRIAVATGVARVTAHMLPTDKVTRLRQLTDAGHKVLMVGDGLNDAPALAAAHASLSPATAADISQTAADAIFQGEALRPVLETIAVARATRRMSFQNFAIAICYNVVFVPLAIAGLVTPLIAAVAMSASSIAVTANAMRLRRKRLRLGTLFLEPRRSAR